jgi:hypothetical protein
VLLTGVSTHKKPTRKRLSRENAVSGPHFLIFMHQRAKKALTSSPRRDKVMRGLSGRKTQFAARGFEFTKKED